MLARCKKKKKTKTGKKQKKNINLSVPYSMRIVSCDTNCVLCFSHIIIYFLLWYVHDMKTCFTVRLFDMLASFVIIIIHFFPSVSFLNKL